MLIKIYKNFKSKRLNLKFNRLIENYNINNSYSFTSIFSYLEFLQTYFFIYKCDLENINLLSVENNEGDIVFFIPFLKFNSALSK